MAENETQRQPYHTTFTPTQPAPRQESVRMPANVTTYGVSNFEPQPPTNTIYQAPPPPIQFQGAPVSFQNQVSSPPPPQIQRPPSANVIPASIPQQSAPEGG